MRKSWKLFRRGFADQAPVHLLLWKRGDRRMIIDDATAGLSCPSPAYRG